MGKPCKVIKDLVNITEEKIHGNMIKLNLVQYNVVHICYIGEAVSTLPLEREVH